MANKSAKEIQVKKIVRPYLLHCLADAAQDFANLQFDLTAADTSPERTDEFAVKAEDRPRLEQLRDNYVSRIEKILADLKRLK